MHNNVQSTKLRSIKFANPPMGTPHASAFLVSAKRALEGSRKLPEEGEAAVGEGAPRPAGNGGADSADAEEQERSRERRAASVDQPTLHSGGTGCGGGRRGWGENPERRGEWHLRQLPQPWFMYASPSEKRIPSLPCLGGSRTRFVFPAQLLGSNGSSGPSCGL
jgi:hypothetical protein